MLGSEFSVFECCASDKLAGSGHSGRASTYAVTKALGGQLAARVLSRLEKRSSQLDVGKR